MKFTITLLFAAALAVSACAMKIRIVISIINDIFPAIKHDIVDIKEWFRAKIL